MTGFEQFMHTVSASLGRTGRPAAVSPFTWRHSVHRDVLKDRSRDELSRLFIENSKAIGIDVYETTAEGLNETIRTAVEMLESGPVVLEDNPLLNEFYNAQRTEKGSGIRIWNAGDCREDAILFAEKASVGIAVSIMALAESATVLLFSRGGCGRSVTLLPESVIYIVPESCIHPRLTQGMEFLRQNKNDLPSSINFVSGPSATSDIELVRVVGVHGPMRVAHIVVKDM